MLKLTSTCYRCSEPSHRHTECTATITLHNNPNLDSAFGRGNTAMVTHRPPPLPCSSGPPTSCTPAVVPTFHDSAHTAAERCRGERTGRGSGSRSGRLSRWPVPSLQDTVQLQRLQSREFLPGAAFLARFFERSAADLAPSFGSDALDGPCLCAVANVH